MPLPFAVARAQRLAQGRCGKCAAADYERDDSGTWTFQGEPFNGEIEAIAS